MSKILGIDTSNYTTSIAVVDNNELLYDNRVLLDVKMGERGLRQSEALFQHIKILPTLLNNPNVLGIDGVCVSTKPRPIENSYMPTFKAGESVAEAISYTKGVPLFRTSHQEGHIEAAVKSIDFNKDEFIAIHISGGTTEVLHVKRNKELNVNIIGGTKDISMGQFIDRVGVGIGLSFPAGKLMDSLALESPKTNLRIPSKVDDMFFNLSGQETQGLRYIEKGKTKEEIAFAVMLCISKTLDKLINNILKVWKLPIILMGGVASSKFIKEYLKNKYNDYIYFCDGKYASDNAVGIAYIGSKYYNK
ncbi:MAG: O-sialoglycoprotein endopeptidase [Clostridiales bacterium]|jgi:N6-L-threonylcarbamoyladenine synthase|nr:O-sialoglycoprotein endopeptidase [Clostridiales bacterium]